MMERTQEENCAVFLDILEDIENGMFAPDACEKHGVLFNTFKGWKKGRTEYIPDARTLYTHAKEERANAWVRQAFNIALSPAVSNEFGVDKGDVELRKVQIELLKWASAQTNKQFSSKAHDTEDQKPKDIGAIVVNLIQDTKPRD